MALQAWLMRLVETLLRTIAALVFLVALSAPVSALLFYAMVWAAVVEYQVVWFARIWWACFSVLLLVEGVLLLRDRLIAKPHSVRLP